jgi:hypothetical protein
MTCRASHWKLKRIEISWFIYAILVLCLKIITTEFIIVSYQHDVPLRSHEKTIENLVRKTMLQKHKHATSWSSWGWGIKKYVRLQKIFLWGSQNKYLRHQKKICPWNPLFSMVLATVWRQNRAFLWYLHRFGSGPRNRAFAGLDAAVSTAPATLWSSNFWFSMVALKLTLV